ncbi:MAG: hypothetical protein N2109_01015 [Fimbriimonadales bacterium]|nr:hypothetical protein [Fimbriimonadales bacterium]
MAILELLAIGWIAQSGATITPPGLGLQFDVPKDWKVVQRRGTMQLALPASFRGARVDIFSASFKKEAETWLAVEAAIANQLKREVVRQWQEELLGVPLLMTELRWRQGESQQAALSGLLYAWTPRKLHFRLQAPEESFAEAVVAWRNVLSTFRTVDGRLPAPEDPDKPWDPAEAQKPSVPLARTVLEPRRSGTTRLELAPRSLETVVAGRPVELRLPEDWAADRAGDFEWTLKHPKLPFAVKVGLYSTLDSPAPERTLVRVSAESLRGFREVTRREEPPASPNRAGATLRRVWRTGQGPAGPVWSLEAVGSKDRFYWLVSVSREGTLGNEERRIVESLLQAMSLEPVSP